MSGEGYTGHINGDSHPHQFKIPAATSSQIGVMTPAQAEKLENIPPGGAGINAFTTTTATFVQPAVNANVTVNVDESRWIAPTQILFHEAGGFYEAISLPSNTSVTLKNLGYSVNAVPAVNVPIGTLSPGGLEGPEGPDGPQGPPGIGSSFGVKLSTLSGGPEVFCGLSGIDADPFNVAGRIITEAVSFTKVSASISPRAFVAPAPVYRIKLYVSTDGGISYSFVTGATIDLDIATLNYTSGIFAEVNLAATSVHLIGVQQLSGGGNTVNQSLAVTWS